MTGAIGASSDDACFLDGVSNREDKNFGTQVRENEDGGWRLLWDESVPDNT
jgi:hypothetical protein